MEPGVVYTYYPELPLGKQKWVQSAWTACVLLRAVMAKPHNVKAWVGYRTAGSPGITNPRLEMVLN